MKRALLLGSVLVVAACGGKKTFDSVCANQVPPPAACNTSCDPAAGSTTACPSGYHCNADGKCDAVCTPGGTECGSGFACTADGYCVDDGSGGGEVDACPSKMFAAKKTTPTVQLLLDQSGSMTSAYGGTDRWEAMVNALVDPTTGVVKVMGDKVVFGAALFTSHATGGSKTPTGTCPILTSKDRTLNNFVAISGLLKAAAPDDETPTPESIDAMVADFKAHPPMDGSPPIIVLATDGLPDTCANANPSNETEQAEANAKTVAAAQRAYQAGIKLFYLFVGNNTAGTHPQQVANAGAGLDPATGTAKYYVATDPTQLSQAFNDIVGGVLSCDLQLDGKVNADAAQSGAVTLNGSPLTYGKEWTVDNDGVTIHILGDACARLKAATDPTVNATFSCNAVIIF